VLKGELGFPGFLVSDWKAIDQIDADFYECVVHSINAGLDMIMVPFEFLKFIETLTQAVEKGDIPLARIDDAVRRILSVKFQLGMFEQPFGDESLLAELGSQAHRAIAREAVQKSLVLLKNEGATLPLDKTTGRILLAGEGADDLGLQCGGWTIEWLGGRGRITDGTSLCQALWQTISAQSVIEFSVDGTFAANQKAPVAIVVLSEPPYAEGMGDRADLTLPQSDIDLIKRVRPHCERLIVLLFSGRPLVITEGLPLADAFVAAWLPGSEGQGIADVLFGAVPVTGKTSFTWPRSMAQVPRSAIKDEPLFPFGFGLTYS
jgi:beta-glucosidase